MSNGYDDFIVFLDDADQKRELYVKVLEISNFVKFEVISGKIISIPAHRVLKIKQRGDSNG